MIYAVEQFQGTHYREIAVTQNPALADQVAAHLRTQNRDMPVRIMEKPESESTVLQQLKERAL